MTTMDPRITSQFIDAAIDHAFRATLDKRVPMMDEIIEKVAAKMGVTSEEIKGPVKLKRLYRARRVAMWACRQQGIPYAVIGEHFGGRDHQTVLSAVRKVEVKVGALQ